MPWVSSNEKQRPGNQRMRPGLPSSRRYHCLGALSTKPVREAVGDVGEERYQATGLARLDRDCAKDLARGGNRLVVMSTRPAACDVRENTLGNVEMAASLDFLHVHHISWK